MAERCITRRRINTLGPVAQWLEQGTHKPFKSIATQPRTAFFHAPLRFCRDWMSLDCAPRDSRAARLLRAFSLPIPPPFISPHRRRLRTSLLPCGAFYAADRPQKAHTFHYTATGPGFGTALPLRFQGRTSLRRFWTE